MHQQLWGYKVEWKSVSRGTGGKKIEYHWSRSYNNRSTVKELCWLSNVSVLLTLFNHFCLHYANFFSIGFILHSSMPSKFLRTYLNCTERLK
jgi:hypothetical protein